MTGGSAKLDTGQTARYRTSTAITVSQSRGVDMPEYALPFDQVQWQDVNEFARQKLITLDGKRIRMLELKAGFKETEWCDRGHIGFVIAGTIHVELEDGMESYSAGNGFLLPDGKRHKAKITSGTVQLFLVDEI